MADDRVAYSRHDTTGSVLMVRPRDRTGAMDTFARSAVGRGIELTRRLGNTRYELV